ncbi:metal ABC transporter substrate-binding protein [Pseudokineococcus sp. 1T1Z-3]|uniref:metal ABC transporter substrate-binding protein n=1 Tax=Pseudokineococcus sp. 1T1Z-3 TaxID=3132745 RepID=UPI0030B73FF8
MTARPARLVALPLAGLLVLAGCGADAGSSTTGAGSTPAAGGATDADVEVVASFYPLQWLTQQVAGDRAEVGSLTTPGVDPHDLELAPRDVATALDADLLVTLGGFQQAVDAAAQQRGDDPVVDVAAAADLEDSPGAPEGTDDGGGDDHDHADDDHAADDHDHGDESHADEHDHAEEGHEHALAEDPHFWLDPVRMQAVAEVVAQGLTDVDPDGADTYAANLADVQAELAAVDEEYATGLATCDSRDLVTAHQAFGYLAERYDLTQRGVTGIGGGTEPTTARLAEVADFVRANDVRTIYTETLLSPAVAETVASETGAGTAVLDTLEGLTDASPGEDYPAVMRADLETLRAGQGCS